MSSVVSNTQSITTPAKVLKAAPVNASEQLFDTVWKLNQRVYRKHMGTEMQQGGALLRLVRDHNLAHALQLLRTAVVTTSMTVSNTIQKAAGNISTIVSLFQVVQGYVFSGEKNQRYQQYCGNSSLLDPHVVHVPLEGVYNVTALQSHCDDLSFPYQVISTMKKTRDSDFESGLDNSDHTAQFFAYATADLFLKSSSQSLFNLYTTNLESLQKMLGDTKPTVQVLQGITLGSFSAYSSNPAPPSLLLEWSPKWVSLHTYCANMNGVGMLTQRGLLRVLTSSLFTNLLQIHSAGYVLRSLSLQSIFVESDGSRVRILPLPTLSKIRTLSTEPGEEMDGREAHTNNDFFERYVQQEQDLQRCAARTTGLSPCLALQSQVEASIGTYSATAQEDLYSLGVCLHTMAFGVPPPQLDIQIFRGDVTAMADFLLYELLDNAMVQELSATAQAQHQGDMQEEGSRSPSTWNASSKVLFAVLDKLHGEKICHLLKLFWKSFAIQAAKGFNLLSDASAALLWEKWLHAVFTKLQSLSLRDTKTLGRNLLALSTLSNKKDLRASMFESIRHTIKQEFDLRMTNQEVEIFIQSLAQASSSGVHTTAVKRTARKSDDLLLDTHEKPFQESVADAMKFLVASFEDIELYDTLQEVVFAISHCLLATTVQSSEASPAISLVTLQQLAICSPATDEHCSRARMTSQAFLYGIRNEPEEFVRHVLMRPLCTCVSDLLESSCVSMDESENSAGSGEVNSLEHQLHRTTLVHISKLLNIVEEILYLRSKSITQMRHADTTKTGVDVDHMSMLPHLQASGIDLHWLSGVANRQVLQLLFEGSFFPLLVMFCLRFLATDAAHVLDEDTSLARSYGIPDKMSMGSLLLLRLSKFFQNSIVCVNSMSRSVLQLKKLVTESGFGEQQQNKEDPMIATSVVEQMDHLLDERETLESNYFTLVSSLLMLCTGEEVLPTRFGQRVNNLTKAYPHVFGAGTDSVEMSENISSIMLVARHHWTSQLCTLFEPLLMEMVAEDGRGSSRCSCSVQCLALADRHQQMLLATHTQKITYVISYVCMCPSLCALWYWVIGYSVFLLY